MKLPRPAICVSCQFPTQRSGRKRSLLRWIDVRVADREGPADLLLMIWRTFRVSELRKDRFVIGSYVGEIEFAKKEREAVRRMRIVLNRAG